MKQTAVEWLFDAVYIDMSYPEILGLIAQAKIMDKQQQDEFAIGFAEWISLKGYKSYSNGWANFNTKAVNEKELLEIYKKEKGL